MRWAARALAGAAVLFGLLAPAGAQINAGQSNPPSTFARPTGNTSTYTQNTLIASSATAGSVVVPLLSLQLGGGVIPRVRLSTNVTTGWGAGPFVVTLWALPPTYTNGDRGAYAVATGAAQQIGQFTITTLTQYADGATGQGTPTIGNFVTVQLYQGRTAVYWDLEYTGSSALTPISGQTFTLVAEVLE